MKKAILLFLLSAGMSGVPKICQADPIEVEVGLQIFDPIGTYPFPRGPVGLPNVYIDDNTLSFENLWGTQNLKVK